MLGPAEACEAAGLALARAGSMAEALPLITEAQEINERLDAHHDAARGEAALRGLGMRRGGRGERRRRSVGWESLTPAELKVVRLTTQGLTYREVASALYISKRTVETHAANIFRKLGISTRRELQEITEAPRRRVLEALAPAGDHHKAAIAVHERDVTVQIGAERMRTGRCQVREDGR